MVCKTQVLLTLKTFSHLYITFFFFLVFIALVFTGCGNDPGTANSLTESRLSPGMMAKNIEVTFSDSGKIQAKLSSVLLNRYPSGGDPYMEFPKGFKVSIYDSAMQVETTISGNYGKRKDYSRIMEARGNVVVRNEFKKQQLNTEYLIWDENKRKIYSTTSVKITTGNMILFGDGLESNESFTDYTILNPHGQMVVKKDSI
jgi:LPS export ABC transporter protein LptC